MVRHCRSSVPVNQWKWQHFSASFRCEMINETQRIQHRSAVCTDEADCDDRIKARKRKDSGGEEECKPIVVEDKGCRTSKYDACCCRHNWHNANKNGIDALKKVRFLLNRKLEAMHFYPQTNKLFNSQQIQESAGNRRDQDCRKAWCIRTSEAPVGENATWFTLLRSSINLASDIEFHGSHTRAESYSRFL